MESINPYAPTTLTSDASIAIDQRLPKSKVTSVAVASRTIAGISLSGGLFGVGLVLVMFLYAGIAFGVGMVIAGFASFTTVSILIGLFYLTQANSDSDAPGGTPWTSERLIFFATLAGTISGFASLAFPTRGSPEALIWALVPAIVGAIGGYAMNRPCLRMLRQERLDRITNESQPADPLAFETPSI